MRNITVYERAVEIGNYVVETGCTVRVAAKKFKVSKSTVHRDLTRILAMESPMLCEEVGKVLTKNKLERHIRGGEAIRQKFLCMKNS